MFYVYISGDMPNAEDDVECYGKECNTPEEVHTAVDEALRMIENNAVPQHPYQKDIIGHSIHIFIMKH